MAHGCFDRHLGLVHTYVVLLDDMYYFFLRGQCIVLKLTYVDSRYVPTCMFVLVILFKFLYRIALL